MYKRTGFKRSQVMTSESFEFHHYKQDTPPTIDFHSHDFYEIYLFIDGTVTYCIEEKTFELMTGDVLIIPPGKLHKPIINNGMSYERMVLWLDREFIKSLDSEEDSLLEEIKKLKNTGQLLVNLKGKSYSKAVQMLEEVSMREKKKDFKSELICKCYITLLLTELIKASRNQRDEKKTVAIESLVPSIIEYINNHLSEKLTSDSIAEKFFISKYHLHHIFKEYTNVSLYDYILSKRIIYAKSLIRHGHNITDACFMCGFKDYSTFYKSFVSKTGQSPKEYKKQRDVASNTSG